MSNTYKDDPSRGLSKLQKAIMVWLLEAHESYKSDGSQMVEGDGPGVPWQYRPTFYGKPINLFGGKSNYWLGETPAVSRSLKRLEERGLIKRSKPGWHHQGKRTKYVRLTDAGYEVSKRLAAEGITSKYKDKRSGALRWLYMMARGDDPCSVCGEAVDKDGHCYTVDCMNYGGQE